MRGGLGERLEGTQLDDTEDHTLEQHRKYDDVDRRCLTQPGRDAHVVARCLGQQDRLALERGLPDQPFAEAEAVDTFLRAV